MKLYHEMKKDHGAFAARSLVRKILEKHEGNVSYTAEELGCSRLCVRRARDGTLEDGDRTPQNQPYKTEGNLEQLVLKERKSTGYGKVRLKKHIKAKYGIVMCPDTIGRIFKRNKIRKQKYKRPQRESKPIYDYEALLPFEEGQVDTKHVEDYGALGNMIFNLRKYNLPSYQWTYVCAKTKIRFLAYSYTLNAQYGLLFMGLITVWLRTHKVQNPVRYQGDNGSEFCSGSKQKAAFLNTILKPADASFISIPTGKKYLQGIVERSHRTDDEDFYRPHLERIRSVKRYIYKAQQWQDTYNSLRQSYGRGMNGNTPLQKLQENYDTIIAEKILHFPVIILDDLFSALNSGNYLCNHYPNQPPNRTRISLRVVLRRTKYPL